eukprot:TRINITY_DN107245_c0_g1_i1.p1 TRINITY_DN107245_c0_g1~~TRINITY_DN107245_c0_g1_i1.p1  ORF type:complete len:205 (+),score=33.16 TRINITY_DN107245_c0_g1_i1:91-705(+)
MIDYDNSAHAPLVWVGDPSLAGLSVPSGKSSGLSGRLKRRCSKRLSLPLLAPVAVAPQAGELRALEQAMRSQVQQFDKLSQNIELLVRSNFNLVEHMREGGGNVAGSAHVTGVAPSTGSLPTLSPRAAIVRRVASNALNNLLSNFELGLTRTGNPYIHDLGFLSTLSQVSTLKSVDKSPGFLAGLGASTAATRLEQRGDCDVAL